MKLHQVYTSDRERIIRSVYAEDLDFIRTSGKAIGVGLDFLVNESLGLMNEYSKLFRVETDKGALVGFFVMSGGKETSKTIEVFHVRSHFRTDEVMELWWGLISSNASHGFYASTGIDHFSNVSHLIENKTVQLDSRPVSGKNFVIFGGGNN